MVRVDEVNLASVKGEKASPGRKWEKWLFCALADFTFP